jgi:hypothetical protein
VFENRVLWRIFGPKRDGVTVEWRNLLNGVFNDLYCLPKIVRVFKSRRMRGAGHVAGIGGGEVYTWFLWGNTIERGHFGNRGVDWRIILRWIFRKQDVGLWTGSSSLRIETVGGHL